MTNLSQWFLLSEQTPWEVGVYEVEDSWGCIWMCRWNGEKFLAQAKNAGIANLQTHSATICIRRWRGLSTSPEVKKKPQNKRKTMYVVMNAVTNNPTASFFSVNSARDYAETVNFPVRVKKIRFRTPE